MRLGPSIGIPGDAASTGGFSPVQLDNLALWLRADLGITLNATDVSAWADQSGQGHHETQATGALQPLWVASDAGYNGKPTLDMTGGEYMSSGAWGAALPQPFTAYVVGNGGSVADYRIYWGDTTSPNGPLVLAEAGDGFIYEQAGATTIVTAVPGQSKHAICGIAAGASSAIYVDSANTTSATGDPGAQSLNGVVVGAYLAGSFPLTGKLAELIVCSGAHTAAVRLRVMTYLGSRYGITIT